MKKSILITLAIVFVIALILAIQFAENKSLLAINAEAIASQNAFSALREPDLFELGDIESISKLVSVSHLVMVGNVRAKSGDVSSIESYSPDLPETAIKNKGDKAGREPVQMTFGSYVIDVVECLYGSINNEPIVLVQPIIGEGYEPDFQPNDKLVFFLRKIEVNGAINTYIAIHPHASYIFINQGDRINPVYKKNEFLMLADISLNQLKQKIKSCLLK